MQRITFCLFVCLSLTACTVGIVRQDSLTPLASVAPTPIPTPTGVSPLVPTGPPTTLPTLPPITLPPIPAPTVAAVDVDTEPTIFYFRAVVNGITYDAREEPLDANPGDIIRFEWETKAISTTVTTMNQWLLELDRVTVNNTGSLIYQVQAEDSECLLFELHASSGGESESASFKVSLPCAHALFFSSEQPSGRGCARFLAPSAKSCPSTPLISDAVEQHFEHGIMIWVKEQDGIYVLFDDEPIEPDWAYYPDNWSEDIPNHDPLLTPPEGLYQPVRGFGLIWREIPYVRERLGWAIDQETAFTTIVQTVRLHAHDTEFYIRALDGDVWYLQVGSASDYWSEWER